MKNEKSCGTIIYRYKENKRQFLLIHQRRGDFIGFPKGHMEVGESEYDTAIRETKEETNLDVFVFEDVKTTIRYIIHDDINKEVVFFLATALSDHPIIQEQEVIDMMWIDENEVFEKLTHQTSKDAFSSIIKQFSKSIEYQMDIHLINYLYTHILPIYKSLDQAHQNDHIHQVLKTSLEIAQNIDDIDLRYVYVIAFYHDIGNLFGRDDHHITGAKYLSDDQLLTNYFDEDEIKIMKEAVEDHRASNDEPPRSIYGKIIAEADREIIPEKIIKRTVQFGISHYPDLLIDEHIRRVLEHLHEKYGEKGYLKLWLDSKKNVEGLKNLRSLLKDEQKVIKIIRKYYKEYKKI
ncbi:MAG: NUDIX domain-containing protein [Acholeplasmataceae bacterium]